MPKKANSDLKTGSGKTYKSQIRAVSKYTGEGAGANKDEASVERIALRVDKGWKQRMKDHVAANPDKYSSITDMLKKLIEQEIPDIKDIKKDKNK